MSAIDKPNMLFIMTDQQSADLMSCAIGNDYINTPNMDWLAAQGTRFTRAYSPNPSICPRGAPSSPDIIPIRLVFR